MAKNAAQRYASMRDFGNALRAYLQTGTAASQSGVGLTAVAAAARTAASAPAPSAAPEPASFPDKIEFACPECGLTVGLRWRRGARKASVPVAVRSSRFRKVLPSPLPAARPTFHQSARVPSPLRSKSISRARTAAILSARRPAPPEERPCPSCSRVVDIPGLGLSGSSRLNLGAVCHGLHPCFGTGRASGTPIKT